MTRHQRISKSCNMLAICDSDPILIFRIVYGCWIMLDYHFEGQPPQHSVHTHEDRRVTQEKKEEFDRLQTSQNEVCPSSLFECLAVFEYFFVCRSFSFLHVCRVAVGRLEWYWEAKPQMGWSRTRE